MEDLKNVLKESREFYLDQKKTLIARIALLPKGTIKRKKINSSGYYYLQCRRAGKVVQEYLGKEYPTEVAAGLERRKELELELKKVRESLRLVKSEKSDSISGSVTVDLLLKKITAAGLWESGIEIIGAWCFIIYQKFLPVEKYPLRTQDLDLLIPYPYRGKKFDFPNLLRELGFEERFNHDGSTYYTAAAIKVEFLSPGKSARKKSNKTIDLAVNPQYLNYVELLSNDPIELKIMPGTRVRVPAPRAFFFHKLLVASLPERAAKRDKDIRQAVYVGKYLLRDAGLRSQLQEVWEKLPQSWKNRIKKSIESAAAVVPLEQNAIRELQKVLP